MTKITSESAPARISFITGGDKDHYLEALGWGNALNATINLCAKCSISEGKAAPENDRILSTLLEYYKKTYGVGDLHFQTSRDFPKESGLGGSAAHCIAIIRALDRVAGVNRSKHETAMLANEVERKWLGIDGGYQDQFASAFGGFNYMKFRLDQGRPVVEVKHIDIGKDVVEGLEKMMLLVHVPREVSGDAIHKSMREGTEGMAYFMSIKRDLCELARVELMNGDLEGFARTVDLEYQLKKKQSPLTVTKRMDEVYNKAKNNGAIGMKFMGAGGGGCAIIFTHDKESLANVLRDDVQILEFRFEGMEHAKRDC